MTEDQAWRRIAVLGDSIAVHRGDPVDGYPTRTWAEQLLLALTPDEYRNFGVSGARAAEIRAGQLAPALAFRPDLAILAAGANDAVRRSYRTGLIEAELAGMIGALSRAGSLVVTLGCFDLSRTLGAEAADRLRDLSVLTERLSHRYGGMHIDFSQHPEQFSQHPDQHPERHPEQHPERHPEQHPEQHPERHPEQNAGQRDGVLGADGLHINARGHAIVAATLLSALKPGHRLRNRADDRAGGGQRRAVDQDHREAQHPGGGELGVRAAAVLADQHVDPVLAEES
jgi:lysophospholipase L1-like esterase